MVTVGAILHLYRDVYFGMIKLLTRKTMRFYIHLEKVIKLLKIYSFRKDLYRSRIGGSYIGGYVESYLLEYNAVYSAES
jgi:hypothetical protein